MKVEIKELHRRIADDRKKIEQLNKMVVSDSVACGRKGKKPIRTVRIKGIPRVELSRRKTLMEKRIAKVEMLETDLIEKQLQVEIIFRVLGKANFGRCSGCTT